MLEHRLGVPVFDRTTRGSTLTAVGEAWVLPMPGSLFHRHVEGLFMAAGVTWPRDAVHTNSLTLSERLVLEGRRIMLMT